MLTRPLYLLPKKKIHEGLKLIKKDNENFTFSAKAVETFFERSFNVKNNKVTKSLKKKYIISRSNNLKEKFVDAGQFYFGTEALFKSSKTAFHKNSNVIKYKKFESVDINDLEDFIFAKKIFK